MAALFEMAGVRKARTRLGFPENTLMPNMAEQSNARRRAGDAPANFSHPRAPEFGFGFSARLPAPCGDRIRLIPAPWR